MDKANYYVQKVEDEGSWKDTQSTIQNKITLWRKKLVRYPMMKMEAARRKSN